MLTVDTPSNHPWGRVVLTRNARARLSDPDLLAALQRHRQTACGQPAAGPRRWSAPLQGCRLLSTYRARDGTPFWIISESGLSLTRVFLPEEFRRS